jgi:hypothetical protein
MIYGYGTSQSTLESYGDLTMDGLQLQTVVRTVWVRWTLINATSDFDL